MRVVRTRYLADGRGFNHGQEATLIEVERPEDYDTLLGNILSSGYYDAAYFESHSGQRDARKIPHLWLVARMVWLLGGRSALDVGCGRGDMLWFLQRRGVDVTGVDFSADAEARTWPELKGRLVLGDLRTTCESLAARGRAFDTVCGLDIWEHLHPRELEGALRAAMAVTREDGLFFFVVPAFGQDRVFGEPFPLEFEENRQDFEKREPFRYLLAEKTEPLIPASGHLVWAHTEWWEARFKGLGLERVPALEQGLHAVYDAWLPNSVRAFYVLRRAGQARARVEAASRAVERESRWALYADLLADIARGTLPPRAEGLELLNRVVGSSVPKPVKHAVKRLLLRR